MCYEGLGFSETPCAHLGAQDPLSPTEQPCGRSASADPLPAPPARCFLTPQGSVLAFEAKLAGYTNAFRQEPTLAPFPEW